MVHGAILTCPTVDLVRRACMGGMLLNGLPVEIFSGDSANVVCRAVYGTRRGITYIGVQQAAYVWSGTGWSIGSNLFALLGLECL